MGGGEGIGLSKCSDWESRCPDLVEGSLWILTRYILYIYLYKIIYILMLWYTHKVLDRGRSEFVDPPPEPPTRCAPPPGEGAGPRRRWFRSWPPPPKTPAFHLFCSRPDWGIRLFRFAIAPITNYVYIIVADIYFLFLLVVSTSGAGKKIFFYVCMCM